MQSRAGVSVDTRQAKQQLTPLLQHGDNNRTLPPTWQPKIRTSLTGAHTTPGMMTRHTKYQTHSFFAHHISKQLDGRETRHQIPLKRILVFIITLDDMQAKGTRGLRGN
jgi:hypothetical protein